MARTCGICGRGALNANSRSHSNIATAKRQHINLQSLSRDGKRVGACTSCIRGASKQLRDASTAHVAKTAVPAV